MSDECSDCTLPSNDIAEFISNKDSLADRRYSGPKFRHHSVDDDYYNRPPYGAYPPYYNGYDYDKYGNGYRSHPSLYHDGKYQHPNARYSHVSITGHVRFVVIPSHRIPATLISTPYLTALSEYSIIASLKI